MDDVAWCVSAGAVCSQALDSQRARWGLRWRQRYFKRVWLRVRGDVEVL